MSKIRPSTQIMPEGSPLQVLRINAAGTAIEAAAAASVAARDGTARVAESAPTDAAFWLPAAMNTVSVSAVSTDRAVTLAPGATWESGVVQEPNVWYDYAANQWRMLYTGGWTSAALGYATATHPLGPWTKSGSNPFIGIGNGGESSSIAHSFCFKDTDGQFYVYYATTATGSDIYVAQGEPPASVKYGTALTHTTSAATLANCFVWREGSTYNMMFESRDSADSLWKLGHATATSPLGPFTISLFPTTGLQVGTGSWSGPCVRKVGTTYVMMYHPSTSGTLATAIYRASSTDLHAWTRETGPFVGRVVDPPEHDQVADPEYHVTDFGAFTYWSAMNNTTPAGSIMVSEAVLSSTPEWYDGKSWHLFSTATAGELLMQDGVSAPPVPIENEARTDWLYQG